MNGEALIAFGLATVLIVSLMLNGPLYNTLNVVLTDSGELTQEHSDASRAIRGGTDIMLGTTGNDAILTDTTSGTSLQAMRQATKNVFYTTVNSAAYENYVPGAIPGWHMASYIIEGVVVALLAVAEILLVRGYLKKKKGQLFWPVHPHSRSLPALRGEGTHHHKNDL